MPTLYAPAARLPGETRAAVSPGAAKELVAMGLTVRVDTGLGANAGWSDEAYREAGAETAEGDAAWGEADVVVVVEPIEPDRVASMKAEAVLIGLLSPVTRPELVRRAAEQRVTTLAMEFVPRISRAQAMDALSSQASIAGYKAVVVAADACPKMLPMMMTAAGTLSPAKVFVIGAGVAGLQAVATAKRLGATVEAYDVRAATKEQVQSLGARFVELPSTGDAEAAGGYAKEQTDEERQKLADLMAKHVIGADIVVTTAAVFGKAPPMLIPADVANQMKPGSVLVDLGASADFGTGNCELTRPGETYTTNSGVTVVGATQLPASVPTHASQVYANNIKALVALLVQDGQLKIDLKDEVVLGAAITHGGEIVNDLVRQAVEAG